MSSEHIVIIGGSSGIGLATARVLLEEGFHVTIAGRDEARLMDARKALGMPGTRLDHARMDARDAVQRREFFARMNPVDHVVLALGSRRGLGPFESLSLDDVREGFEEKVFPQLACAQAATSVLRPDGSITFIGAVTAHSAIPGTSGIGAANGAIAAVIPILAAELRPRRVNAVSPGTIDTPWWDFVPEEQRRGLFAETAKKTPVGRIGMPEDVARAIAFLISDSFMTGEILICDGGARLIA